VLFALALIALVAINGLFVAAEFALVRARKDRMESLVEEGRRGARLALRQIERIDEYLSACQVGITLASIGIGFLGERAIGDQLEGALEGVVGAVAGGILGFLLAYFITTFAHITIGEQVPKIYAITHAEATARLIAGTLELFRVAAKPFIWLVNVSSNAMLRVVGVNAQAEFEEPANQEEVKMLIARGMQGGTLDPGEATMLSGVFHLHEQQARQVMTPIPAVVTVDVSEDVRTALERCVESGHTRLVVTEDENTDRIRGVVHSNSLVRRLMREGPETSVEGSVKEALIVPETRALDDLLADLQRERMSVAVVVDEYGRTVGIVSVEDIVEEVVGEIADETDPAPRACAAWPTTTGTCAATSRSPTSTTTACTSKSTPTPTTRSAGSSSRSSVACPSAATWSAPTTTRCGWSPCARTASRRCASAITSRRGGRGSTRPTGGRSSRPAVSPPRAATVPARGRRRAPRALRPNRASPSAAGATLPRQVTARTRRSCRCGLSGSATRSATPCVG
jgi:Hemolysins and related proteins containing CBS domains